MMRHLKILEYALSSLLRRKYRNISLIAVYALTIGILASVLFLTYSLKLEATRILIDAPDLIIQKIIRRTSRSHPVGIRQNNQGHSRSRFCRAQVLGVLL